MSEEIERCDIGPIKATRIDGLKAENPPPGAFDYFGVEDRNIGGLVYVCPCGCGRQILLDFHPGGPRSRSWIWDGNIEAPTLKPSIHYKIDGETHWHGDLVDGEFRPSQDTAG